MTNEFNSALCGPGRLPQIYRPSIPEEVQAVILGYALKYGGAPYREHSELIKQGLEAYQILNAEMEKIGLGGTDKHSKRDSHV